MRIRPRPAPNRTRFRSKASAAKGDVAKASEQTVDEDALRKIQTSAKRIDERCHA